MTLLSAERDSLATFRQWLTDRFGARLREVVLFGSRARGEGSEDSDLDVLVVVEDLTSSEAREVRYVVGDLLTRHGILVSPLAMSHHRFEQLRRRERRLAQEIARDGIPL